MVSRWYIKAQFWPWLRNNHPRAGQLNPAHQHRVPLVNHRRVLLVNRLVSRVNRHLVHQEPRLPESLQERP